MPGRIVRVPHQHARHAAVHADGHDAGHAEADVWGRDVGDHGVADDGDGEGEEHHYSAELEAVGQERYENFGNVSSA